MNDNNNNNNNKARCPCSETSHTLKPDNTKNWTWQSPHALLFLKCTRTNVAVLVSRSPPQKAVTDRQRRLGGKRRR